jgi:2-polyprenyl-3-methyl-5-hydroxy-6-metoxy-1,4-benzoquinol methylase
MSHIVSPITKSQNVSLVAEIDKNIVIQNYKNECKIDVSRYFENLENIKIYRCEDTGYKFYYPLNLSGDAVFYEDLQKNLDSYYSVWKWENKIALKQIKKTDKVLDVGCGSGKFLEKLFELNIDGNGLEFNDNAIIECLKKGFDVKKHSVEEHSNDYKNFYDVVCHFQVLEHIVEPQEFIADCIKLLKPGGKLIIGVPNNNPFLFKNDKFHTLNLPPHHMGLWSREALAALGKFNNLEIEKIVVEPLYNMAHYLYINHGLPKNIGNYINKLKPLAHLREGRNVVAIFKK